MKRLALLTVVILLTLLLVVVVWQLRDVVLMFFLALVIAAALDEPVDALAGRGWPRHVAIATVYLAVIGVLVLLVAAISGPMLNELDPLIQTFLIYYTDLQARMGDLSGQRPVYIPRLPTTEQVAALLVTNEGDALAQGAMQLVGAVGRFFGQLALAIVVAIYWTADQTRFERVWLSLLAPDRRARARTLWRTLESQVGAYLRSELIQSVLAGSLLTLGYWLLGVRFPFILALLAALAWLIPLVGGGLAVILAGLGGALTNYWVGAGAGLLTLAVLLLLEFWLERKLYRHERYWGVLVVIVLLALGDALGLVGLLVAPLVALAMQIVLNSMLDTHINPVVENSHEDLPELCLRLAELKQRVEQADEQPSPRLVNLVQRLETMLAEAEQSTSGS